MEYLRSPIQQSDNKVLSFRRPLISILCDEVVNTEMKEIINANGNYKVTLEGLGSSFLSRLSVYRFENHLEIVQTYLGDILLRLNLALSNDTKIDDKTTINKCIRDLIMVFFDINPDPNDSYRIPIINGKPVILLFFSPKLIKALYRIFNDYEIGETEMSFLIDDVLHQLFKEHMRIIDIKILQSKFIDDLGFKKNKYDFRTEKLFSNRYLSFPFILYIGKENITGIRLCYFDNHDIYYLYSRNQSILNKAKFSNDVLKHLLQSIILKLKNKLISQFKESESIHLINFSRSFTYSNRIYQFKYKANENKLELSYLENSNVYFNEFLEKKIKEHKDIFANQKITSYDISKIKYSIYLHKLLLGKNLTSIYFPN